MPYVPSKKTNPPAEDRDQIDPFVESLAEELASKIDTNFSLIKLYREAFVTVASDLRNILKDEKSSDNPAGNLARVIHDVGAKYGYEGAYLGELNYAITRLIQRVPQIMVKNDTWKEEIRYWLYAATVEALMRTAHLTEEWEVGIGGVFTDIKDEYKWRINRSYEAAQILKSGDCYDAPFYGRLIEFVDEHNNLIGHQEIWLKRSPETVDIDLLPFQVVVKKRKE